MEKHFSFDQNSLFPSFYVLHVYKIVALKNGFAVLRIILKIMDSHPFHFADGEIALEKM